MRQRGKVFQISIIIFSLTLLAGALPAQAGPITIDEVFRDIQAGGGLNFKQETSSLPGFFDKNFSLLADTESERVVAFLYQSSDIVLNNNVLAVNAATYAELFTFPKPGFESGGGFATSELRLQFTLNDWASYQASDIILVEGNWASPTQNEVSFQSTTTGQRFFLHHIDEPFRLEERDRHSGLLAPGSYKFHFLAGGHLNPGAGDHAFSSFAPTLTVSIVPEPSSLLLLACAMCLLAASQWIRWPQRAISTS